jgi:hypothetical protein
MAVGLSEALSRMRTIQQVSQDIENRRGPMEQLYVEFVNHTSRISLCAPVILVFTLTGIDS